MRITIACVLLALVFVAVFVSVRMSYCPVAVTLKDISPSGMVDAAGKEMWAVTVVMTNSEYLQFEPNSITIEAKKKNNWSLADGNLSGFWSGRTSGIIFVVPAGTTHYKVQFAYQREMLKWRLWEKLGQRGQRIVTKYAPGITARIWPRNVRTTLFREPPIWKHALVVSRLPNKVDSEPF